MVSTIESPAAAEDENEADGTEETPVRLPYRPSPHEASSASQRASLSSSYRTSPPTDMVRRSSPYDHHRPFVHSASVTPPYRYRQARASVAQHNQHTPLSQYATSSSRLELKTAGCTCKKSRCLKLYCQCFASSTTCGPNCKCGDCRNSVDHGTAIDAARKAILLRNPTAFSDKIRVQTITVTSTSTAASSTIQESQPHHQHQGGCKCRKSHCLKKYCECFSNANYCGLNCKCYGCKNCPPSSQQYKNPRHPPPPLLVQPSSSGYPGAAREHWDNHRQQPAANHYSHAAPIQHHQRQQQPPPRQRHFQDLPRTPLSYRAPPPQFRPEIPSSSSYDRREQVPRVIYQEHHRPEHMRGEPPQYVQQRHQQQQHHDHRQEMRTSDSSPYTQHDHRFRQDSPRGELVYHDRRQEVPRTDHPAQQQQQRNHRRYAQETYPTEPRNHPPQREYQQETFRGASVTKQHDYRQDEMRVDSAQTLQQPDTGTRQPQHRDTQQPQHRDTQQPQQPATQQPPQPQQPQVQPPPTTKREPLDRLAMMAAVAMTELLNGIGGKRNSPTTELTSSMATTDLDDEERNKRKGAQAGAEDGGSEQVKKRKESTAEDDEVQRTVSTSTSFHSAESRNPSPVSAYRSASSSYPTSNSPRHWHSYGPPPPPPPPPPPQHHAAHYDYHQRMTPSPPNRSSPPSYRASPPQHPLPPQQSYEELLRTTGLPKALSFRKICSRCGKTRGEHGELGFGNKCAYQECGKCGAGHEWHELSGQSMGILCQLTVSQGAIPGAAAAYDRKIRELAARADLQRTIVKQSPTPSTEHSDVVAAADPLT